jgi:hypothetical protein
MARYTLVYGLRLIPEGTLKGIDEAGLKLADGSDARVTLHTLDGTIPQLRRSLDRSLDAFFDLLPGADEEDLEKFAD